MFSQSSSFELVAVLYTELLKERKPCYASEICDRVPGLRRKQDAVARLLQIMCENGMAVNIRGKYILKENLPPEPDENLASLTCDGPVYGTIYQREGTMRTAPVLSSVGAVVPVQQTTVQRSSSSDFSCDTSDLMVYTDILTKITDFLKGCSGAVKAKDIAQRTGIGQSRSDVNRYLYLLKNHNIIQDNGKAEWTLIQEVKGDDLRVCAAELAKIPGGKSKGKVPQSGSSSSLCDCPNAGPGCVHVTNNYQQNIHHHHHNIQIGERNQMLAGLPPDGAPPGGHQQH
ncbi:uncharacterized protein LOC123534939 isoform X2 [Mercenaria mercenaria]|uniref:uncharacterized protein LOC123534939 isoform X2 n=1 Tax=Mercenaria mercenaria TaxID=6596 RepID=UPI00234F2E19|nr:uncharacterized protein LOC123534939 isoform X2 [Mercenaria mercenaria]